MPLAQAPKVLIESMMSGKVDVLNAGVGKAALRCGKPIGHPFVGSKDRFQSIRPSHSSRLKSLLLL